MVTSVFSWMSPPYSPMSGADLARYLAMLELVVRVTSSPMSKAVWWESVMLTFSYISPVNHNVLVICDIAQKSANGISTIIIIKMSTEKM